MCILQLPSLGLCFIRCFYSECCAYDSVVYDQCVSNVLYALCVWVCCVGGWVGRYVGVTSRSQDATGQRFQLPWIAAVPDASTQGRKPPKSSGYIKLNLVSFGSDKLQNSLSDFL